MGLEVCHSTVENRWTGEDEGESWTVSVEQVPWDEPRVVSSGFQRKADAEIAMNALNKLDINWDADAESVLSQCMKFGLKNLKKAACEHLQW